MDSYNQHRGKYNRTIVSAEFLRNRQLPISFEDPIDAITTTFLSAWTLSSHRYSECSIVLSRSYYYNISHLQCSVVQSQLSVASPMQPDNFIRLYPFCCGTQHSSDQIPTLAFVPPLTKRNALLWYLSLRHCYCSCCLIMPDLSPSTFVRSLPCSSWPLNKNNHPLYQWTIRFLPLWLRAEYSPLQWNDFETTTSYPPRNFSEWTQTFPFNYNRKLWGYGSGYQTLTRTLTTPLPQTKSEKMLPFRKQVKSKLSSEEESSCLQLRTKYFIAKSYLLPSWSFL